jgi:hypothetical protein
MPTAPLTNALYYHSFRHAPLTPQLRCGLLRAGLFCCLPIAANLGVEISDSSHMGPVRGPQAFNEAHEAEKRCAACAFPPWSSVK